MTPAIPPSTAIRSAARRHAICTAMPSAAAASVVSAPLTGASPTPAAPTSSTVKLTVVTSAVSQPVLVTSPRDGTNRLFIVEKTGQHPDRQGRLAARARRSSTSRGSVSTGGEQGLLGLAFHPGFKTNRKFYVDYTDRSGNTVVREYRASSTNPDRVAAGSGRTIITDRASPTRTTTAA